SPIRPVGFRQSRTATPTSALGHSASAWATRAVVVAAAACATLASLPRESDAWIDHAIRDVCDQVYADEHDDEQQQRPLHDRVVAIGNGVDDEPAHPRPAKHRLRDHAA